MRVKVQKWGNSLALRIPRSLAVESQIEKGSEVNVSLVEGNLVVTPVTKQRYVLGRVCKLYSGVERL